MIMVYDRTDTYRSFDANGAEISLGMLYITKDGNVVAVYQSPAWTHYEVSTPEAQSTVAETQK